MNDFGCPMPDTCMAMTYGNDGSVCPVACPVTCPEDQMWCDGGYDDNGCEMPDTCMPTKGGEYEEDIY